MRDYVEGDDVLILAYKGNDYYPFACVEKVGLKMRTGLVETTEPSAGAWETYTPDGKNGWTAYLSGVQVLKDDVDNLHFAWETLRLQVRNEGYDLKFVWKDRKGTIKYATGFAWVPESTLDGVSGDFGRWDIQLQGSGPLDLNGVITPPVNPKGMRIDWTTTGAEPNKLQHNSLIAVTRQQIMVVSLEGNDVFEVIDAGEPTDKQVRLDSAEGSLRWAYDFEAGYKAYCVILNN